ncbi:MAG TPA: SMC-Scp complex subunit ScpB [Tetrasphaera sp.]|uniref:SMC-Scp complex subunit ScpB n=1 Tax=Nostocoides vanveenii TaxID=330835 RepID=A0ABP4WHJ4_9MICO|nr:SMC-Scp complex subunit ScpB [Tetrasphaera sp.]HNQ07981.1 SMC-Scp complex subunit ScpB [Tetrasphaera sp.]
MTQTTEPAPAVGPPPEVEPDVLDVAAMPGGVPGAIEAILMVVDEPVSDIALATALEIPLPEVTDALRALVDDYDGRGFMLREVGGGWRIYSRPEYAAAVERFVLDGAQAKLSHASLETLAIIAYRQPISRGRVSAVRGVNVDGVVRTLLSRGLIEETGAESETGAVLYGTTGYFLERLGLRDLGELPALAPYLPAVETLDDLAEAGRS